MRLSIRSRNKDVNIVQNIGDPIRYAGVQKQRNYSTKGVIDQRHNRSQIMFGDDENYMPMKQTTKQRYQK